MAPEPNLAPAGLGMAGWLFADVLLALAMIFLLSAPGRTESGRDAAVASAVAAEATTVATESESRILGTQAAATIAASSATIQALDSDNIKIRASAAATLTAVVGSENTAVAVRAMSPTACVRSMAVLELAYSIKPEPDGSPPSGESLLSGLQTLLEGHQVGVMYTYGHSERVEDGEQLAAVMNAVLERRAWGPDYPELASALTEKTTFKDGGNINPPYGQIDFEIYLLSDGC